MSAAHAPTPAELDEEIAELQHRCETVRASFGDVPVAMLSRLAVRTELRDLRNSHDALTEQLAQEHQDRVQAQVSEETQRSRCDALVAALADADTLIEEWIGLLLANGLRHSVVDGEAVRAKIATLSQATP
jgi:hypothetical protein